MVFMHDHKLDCFNYSISVMDSEAAWPILTTATILDGHVRVTIEGNPFLKPGQWADHNVQLVNNMVRIASDVGREIVTPARAKQIIGLNEAAVVS
jgi:3-keto-5-aminohexanoate cleavage enzyme